MSLKVVAAITLLSALAFAAGPTTTKPTFHKDVEPILQRNCQTCHRPGEAAPMSLLSYKDVRPWAKQIREAVLVKQMPPWFADSHFGKFSNERTLNEQDRTTLVNWIDSGALEGSIKDAPKPVKFTDGWAIGTPDVVISMPQAFHVQASGVIEYQYVVVPTGFTEDKWVQAAEARPGNRQLVHHIIAFVREPGSKWLADAKPGVIFVPSRPKRSREAGARQNEGGEGGPQQGEMLQGFAPGLPPAHLGPGQAKLIKAGSDIVFQLHYTANGTEGDDQSKLGIIFSKEPPKERVISLGASNPKFAIPPGDSNYQVDAEFTFGDTAKLVNFLPHMHLRGKDFEYRLVYPDGHKETLLRVPNYSFSWQLYYDLAEQIVVPKGAKIECTAHFDNSAANKNNPDPTKEVKWGDQSWDEMMIGFFDVAVPVGKNPYDLYPKRPKPEAKPSLE